MGLVNRPVEWSEFMAPPGSAVLENHSKFEYRIPILMRRGGIAGIPAGGGVKVVFWRFGHSPTVAVALPRNRHCRLRMRGQNRPDSFSIG